MITKRNTNRENVSSRFKTVVPAEHPAIAQMENVSLHYYRNLLKGEVDLSVTIGRSQSGKSTIIATSHGAVELPYNEDKMMSLTVFRYPDRSYTMQQRPHSSPVGNVRFSVRNGKLDFSVDLTAELAVSKSGKSMVIATTGERGIFVSSPPKRIMLILNVYRPIEKSPESEQLSFDV